MIDLKKYLSIVTDNGGLWAALETGTVLVIWLAGAAGFDPADAWLTAHEGHIIALFAITFVPWLGYKAANSMTKTIQEGKTKRTEATNGVPTQP